MRITIEDLNKDIESLKRMCDDDEAAHGFEDAIRGRILESFSKYDYTPQEIKDISNLALSTSDLDFARWCA